MTRCSLAELRQRYIVEGRRLEARIEAELRADGRAGAKAILLAVSKRRFRNRSEGQRIRKMMRFETALWTNGILHVAGVDEAGISPLAGPVSAAAVILPPGTRITGIDNSKKLDPASRGALAAEIKLKATAWHVGFAKVEEIDQINIYWAGILAMRRAVEGLAIPPQHLLLDARRLKGRRCSATTNRQRRRQEHLHRCRLDPGQDIRDAVMRELDQRYPGYGFAGHKGYPVGIHYAALKKLGPAPRRSFAPVRQALGLPPLPPWPAPRPNGCAN